MTEKRKNVVIVILASILGVLIAVILAAFVMPFALMMIVWGGDGKLDDEKKISAAVTENQETLEDIVSRLLEPEQDLDFVLHSDDIFEYDNFKGWRKYDHSEITDHWHYYKLVI